MPPTATKTVVHEVAKVYVPICGSAEDTVTSMCMLDRPVCTSRASTSTTSPESIGRAKFTLPTYAVTQYPPLQPTAQA